MGAFFTADEHLGHNNVLQFCHRPFKDIDHMSEELVRRHNERVSKGDLVYHLGDMFWRTYTNKAAHAYLDQLNGNHYYITGNHEELLEHHIDLRQRFIIHEESRMLHVQQQYIFLAHYAHRVWPKSHHGAWHLFGHSHGTLARDTTLSFDVGVDAWDYYPVSFEEVGAKMAEHQKSDPQEVIENSSTE